MRGLSVHEFLSGPDDQPLTTAQLAKLLGRSVAQLSADRDAGRGPRFTVLDGVVHYRLGDLRAFLNAPAA